MQKTVFATIVFLTTYAIVFSIYFFINYWYGIFESSRFGFEYGVYYWGSVLLSLLLDYMPNLLLQMAGYSLLITIVISSMIIAWKNSVKITSIKKIISRTLIILLIITIGVSLFGFINNYSNGQTYAKTFITQQEFPLAYRLENFTISYSQYNDFNAPAHWNVSVPSLIITNNQTFTVYVSIYADGNEVTWYRTNNTKLINGMKTSNILSSGDNFIINGSNSYISNSYGTFSLDIESVRHFTVDGRRSGSSTP